MKLKFTYSIILILSIIVSGCSVVAPKYAPSISNVETLKTSEINPVSVGKFVSSSDHDNSSSLYIRSRLLHSPYNDSYSDYLAESLKLELFFADKLDLQSPIVITGILLKNALNAEGAFTNSGIISVEFTIKKSAAILFNKTKTVDLNWDGSFDGKLVIANGIRKYPEMVEKLLEKLYTDSDFLRALRLK